jgi:hypothetical protein
MTLLAEWMEESGVCLKKSATIDAINKTILCDYIVVISVYSNHICLSLSDMRLPNLFFSVGSYINESSFAEASSFVTICYLIISLTLLHTLHDKNSIIVSFKWMLSRER